MKTNCPDTPDAIALDERSRELRRVVVRAMTAARRGHLGAAFSIIEILRALYDHTLTFDPRNPRGPDRDRFILSKGHGCLALYAMLADKGFFPAEELSRFCAPDGLLGGHPEFGKVPGVEASTGSLGHGLSIGVGMALHARIQRRPHRVFVLVGDGECGEGTVWEAAMSASRHRLGALAVLIDYNRQQTYGDTESVLGLEPLAAKWRSFGFAVTEVNGHNIPALSRVLSTVTPSASQPAAVICHTVKGKGIPFTERNLEWHHKARISDAEAAALLAALDGES